MSPVCVMAIAMQSGSYHQNTTLTAGLLGVYGLGCLCSLWLQRKLLFMGRCALFSLLQVVIWIAWMVCESATGPWYLFALMLGVLRIDSRLGGTLLFNTVQPTRWCGHGFAMWLAMIQGLELCMVTWVFVDLRRFERIDLCVAGAAVSGMETVLLLAGKDPAARQPIQAVNFDVVFRVDDGADDNDDDIDSNGMLRGATGDFASTNEDDQQSVDEALDREEAMGLWYTLVAVVVAALTFESSVGISNQFWWLSMTSCRAPYRGEGWAGVYSVILLCASLLSVGYSACVDVSSTNFKRASWIMTLVAFVCAVAHFFYIDSTTSAILSLIALFVGVFFMQMLLYITPLLYVACDNITLTQCQSFVWKSRAYYQMCVVLIYILRIEDGTREWVGIFLANLMLLCVYSDLLARVLSPGEQNIRNRVQANKNGSYPVCR